MAMVGTAIPRWICERDDMEKMLNISGLKANNRTTSKEKDEMWSIKSNCYDAPLCIFIHIMRNPFASNLVCALFCFRKAVLKRWYFRICLWQDLAMRCAMIKTTTTVPHVIASHEFYFEGKKENNRSLIYE